MAGAFPSAGTVLSCSRSPHNAPLSHFFSPRSLTWTMTSGFPGEESGDSINLLRKDIEDRFRDSDGSADFRGKKVQFTSESEMEHESWVKWKVI